MIATRLGLMAAIVVMALRGLSAANAGSFFVDKGHTDVVDGIAFEIVPPQLFIKKAFKLRDENLTPAQLLLIREAMPAIADMTQALLRRPSNSQPQLQSPSYLAQHLMAEQMPQPRNVYQLQNIASPIQLYIQSLKNWQVTDTSIQFSSDYFYSPTRGHVVNFRDSYVFTKSAHGWHFLHHPNSTPDGVLACKKTADAWMRCELPSKP
jgi:hypothetical protein